jgi:hypothetical protein
MGAQHQWQWRAACDVYETILRIRKLPPAGTSTDQWPRKVAAQTLSSTGPDGRSGAFGQLRGHLFEHLDIRDYNLRRAGVYRLVRFPDPLHPGYDAIRIDANGKFAGAVQHKCGPASFAQAINKLEAHKPGSACKATIRVPFERFKDCQQAASGKIQVQASRLTNKAIIRRAKTGLHDLTNHGEAATSLGRQAGRAAGKGAAAAIVIEGITDLPALRGRKLNGRQFVARRGVDAAQAGITAAATTTTVVCVCRCLHAHINSNRWHRRRHGGRNGGRFHGRRPSSRRHRCRIRG